MSGTSRNSPCKCGSGKKTKHCHHYSWLEMGNLHGEALWENERRKPHHPCDDPNCSVPRDDKPKVLVVDDSKARIRNVLTIAMTLARNR